MKKIVLVMLAVLACSASFAQFQRAPQCREANPAKGVATFPTWSQISTPFTATDIWGNTVSVADILASGQGIVIDYSCTWCGPCWNMHQSGVLEAIDALPNVQVIWVEIEERNTTAQIFGPQGGSSYNDMTYGDWTLTPEGDTVPYPIIDDASCLNMCASLYEGYVPSIYFIAPNGYFCDIYGTEWGFSGVSDAAAAISNLMNTYPQAGQAPVVSINGHPTAIAGSPVSFTADILSVDPIVSYNWTFADGTPATANTVSATTTWATTGNHQVTLEVTNTTGSTTATFNVNVVECNPQNLPFSCGFEASDNMDCWNFVDADGDGYNWDFDFCISTGNTHSGSGSAASASFINNVGVLTPDNWMITPAIVVPAEGATIEWWVVGQDANYYAEYYSVLVSTTGTNPNDFTNTVFAGTVPGSNWTKVSKSLADFAGQTIYVAFRHHNISDMYWMLLDDISITAGNHAGIDEVNDINVSLYPNPTTGKLNVNAEDVQEINVLDINGRVVMTANNTNAIDMSELSNGCYFVRVITNEGVSTQKIVKK